MTSVDRISDQVELLERTIQSVAHVYNADIFFLVGDLSDDLGHKFVDLCPSVPEAQNCLLLLTTAGGSLEAAYRITRCIQSRYVRGNVMLFTNSLCKSAGTLIALGSDMLIMTDHAELGPLDTQVRVRDEFGEYQSGLIDTDALRILQDEVFANFSGQFSRLLSLGSGAFTAQTASRIASELTLGLFGGIYSQINPIRFGERGHAVQVALEYGQRVSTGNVREGTLEKLATGYPSHGFMIDRRETEELFYEVYIPDEHISTLSEQLHPLVNYFYSSDSPVLEYLNQGVTEHIGRFLQALGTDVPENGEEHNEGGDHDNAGGDTDVAH